MNSSSKNGVPVFKQPIIGFRKWNIDTQNGLLTSCTSHIPWQPGINYASGCQGSHPSPGPNCHCGFNAWFTPADNSVSGYSGVTGAIAAAGDVQLHPTGFRSSEAQVIALCIEGRYRKDLAEKISHRYKIPVFDREEDFIDFVNSIDAKENATSILQKSGFHPSNIPSGLMVGSASSNKITAKEMEMIFWIILFLFLLAVFFRPLLRLGASAARAIGGL